MERSGDRSRIFDYPGFATMLRERVREAAAWLAAEAEIAIGRVAKVTASFKKPIFGAQRRTPLDLLGNWRLMMRCCIERTPHASVRD